MAATLSARRQALKLSHSVEHRLSVQLRRRLSSRSVVSSTVVDDRHQRTTKWSPIFAAVALAAAASQSLTLAESEAEAGDECDDEPTTILNWSGTHSVQLKKGAYHEPESVAELISLVADAYRNGTHIRPVGSALSPNGLAFDSRGMVCLSNLDKIIDVNKDDMTVTVQAGARVSQVIEALRPHGLTLPNLASIAEQQIGGFVSVGAHGTGARYVVYLLYLHLVVHQT